MKAWVLHGINDIRFETKEKPALAPGEVLVKVKAAGICGSDIPRIYKIGAHVHPLVPGHEFSGTVAAAGQGADPGWLGKRVGVFPLIPCGLCGPCLAGQYEMCRNYGYLGSRRDGGFGEYVAVPAENLIELPDSVSFEEAAMLEPMAVAVHAMRRVLGDASCLVNVSAREAAGENLRGEQARAEGVLALGGEDRGQRTAHTARQTVPAAATDDAIIVVWGMGTIGLLLTALLQERSQSVGKFGNLENRILVIGNKDFQRQKILELGLPAQAYCDSRTQDGRQWIMERTGGHGADVIFECVGRNETVRRAVDSAAAAGKVCLVGNPASDMTLEKEVYWKILRNQLTLTGTWNSSFTHAGSDDWHYALDRLSHRDIMAEQLISHRLPLESLEKGLRIMRDKSEDYIKMMAVI